MLVYLHNHWLEPGLASLWDVAYQIQEMYLLIDYLQKMDMFCLGKCLILWLGAPDISSNSIYCIIILIQKFRILYCKSNILCSWFMWTIIDNRYSLFKFCLCTWLCFSLYGSRLECNYTITCVTREYIYLILNYFLCFK